MTENACVGWDITFSADKVKFESIMNFAEAMFKKWTFQKEEGESGYIHFQFRGSLEKKLRKSDLMKIIHSGKLKVADKQVSPTSKECFDIDDAAYCKKENTRIEGPWSSKDKLAYIPLDMRGMPEWRPFQETVREMIALPPNRRKINCIVDPFGNAGKSFLAMWMYCNGYSYYIPCFTEAKELMRMTYAMISSGVRNTFFIDLPRALSHKAENEIYGGIEQLKTGIIYEDRYDFKMMAIDPVHVFIFTNRLPNMKLVSPDRWNIIVLGMDGNIIPPEKHE